MAKRVEIEFISAGFEQILTGSGVQNVVLFQGERRERTRRRRV